MLFLKESKKVVFSITFLLFVLVTFFMYVTQFYSSTKKPERQPLPTDESYSMIVKETPEILMPRAVDSLIGEYTTGIYTAYPIGLYKQVHLKQTQQDKMAELLEKLTGMDEETLNQLAGGKGTENQLEEVDGEFVVLEKGEDAGPTIQLADNLSYATFKTYMAKVDDLIGGGSKYSSENLLTNFSMVPRSYQEAMAEYDTLLADLATGYGRLLCDYLGIVLSVIPVFLAVELFLKDKQAGLGELIYVRKVSSSKLIVTRYLAMVVATVIPLMILLIVSYFKIAGLYPTEVVLASKFFDLCLLWLLPNILLALSLGMCLTVLTGTAIAIFVQVFWWIFNIFTSPLNGNITRFAMLLRHNSLYGGEEFSMGNFLFNRIFFTVVALILILLTIGGYEKKRKGDLHDMRFKMAIGKK